MTFNIAVQKAEPSIADNPKPIRIPKTKAKISLNGRELVKPLLLMIIKSPREKIV